MLRIALGSRLYSVRDKTEVYSMVTVFATSATEAMHKGLAVMFGCTLDRVDAEVVAESINALAVTSHNVREFDRDDWNMAYAGAEGWVGALGTKVIPPITREQRHFVVVGDARGIEVRFNNGEDGWWLDLKMPTQMAAAWFVAMLPQDLSPEFCERIGFKGI